MSETMTERFRKRGNGSLTERQAEALELLHFTAAYSLPIFREAESIVEDKSTDVAIIAEQVRVLAQRMYWLAFYTENAIREFVPPEEDER